jgi:hypothetical protein
MRACAYREADVSARETERERENSFESDDESAKRVHERTRERLRAKETSDTHKRNLCNRTSIAHFTRSNILYIINRVKETRLAICDIAEKRHVDT